MAAGKRPTPVDHRPSPGPFSILTVFGLQPAARSTWTPRITIQHQRNEHLTSQTVRHRISALFDQACRRAGHPASFAAGHLFVSLSTFASTGSSPPPSFSPACLTFYKRRLDLLSVAKCPAHNLDYFTLFPYCCPVAHLIYGIFCALQDQDLPEQTRSHGGQIFE